MKRAMLYVLAGTLLLVVALSVPGASTGLAQGDPTPTTTPPPPVADPLGQPLSFLREYYDLWVASPHAKTDAEAFVHWNAEGKVPGNCSVCHSPSGYVAFLDTGETPAEQPVGGVVTCDACHTPKATTLQTVKFPSGAEVGDMGDSTRCMICHQGRSSTVQVNASIEKLGLKETPDTPSADLRFINIHYYAAAASIYGSEAQGGYQYEGKTYQMRFRHVEGYDTCAGCHNPHTLELKLEECKTCHQDVNTVEDLRNIRMQGSLSDYDGDGNIVEGVADEIAGLQEVLLSTMQVYAEKIAGLPIAYSSSAYPYFFADANGNGEADADEKGYNAFTARLEQAAYNYQVSQKDPGNFAHNAAYHVELLFDSIESLNAALEGDGIDMSLYTRNDPGHFDTTGEPFRHWDAEGVVPGSCAKCHTDSGLPTFLANNANIGVKPSNSLACSTCHDAIPEFTVRKSDVVTFPSGLKVSFGDGIKDNLCLNCHQGRESTASVNRVIASSKAGDDEVTDKLTFRNIHYFAAGASIFGNDAQGAYQFEGKEYNGRYIMDEEVESCSDCHDVHALTIKEDSCFDCHEDADTIYDIRNEETVDFDGDGDTVEGIKYEIEALHTDLLTKIQAYALEKTGVAIGYAPANHPYWYIDGNGNGTIEPEEVTQETRFLSWTPNLLRAAFNYQFAAKDPGQFTHNGHYILQVLYDSLEAVGGADAVAGYARPEVKK